MSAAEAQSYHDLVNIATSQISIATLTTAILGPIAVMLVDRWQKKRGIDGTREDEPQSRVDEDLGVARDG